MQTTSKRFESIDLLRGAALTVMFLVGRSSPIPQLRHGTWMTTTIGDLVYPAFLFLAGMSMSISIERARAAGLTPVNILVRFFRRIYLLFAIGVGLSALAAKAWVLQTGTLQSIAIALSLAVPVAFMHWRARLVAFVGFLALWTIVLTYLTLGDGEPTPWDPEHNLAAQIDTMLFGSFRGVEGLLGSCCASVFVVLGLIPGAWITEGRGQQWLTRTTALALACAALGFCLIGMGPESAWYVPPISRLSSASFTLLAGSMLMASVGAVVFALRGDVLPRGMRLVANVGGNSLVLFAAAKVFQEVVLKATSGEPPVHLVARIQAEVTTTLGATAGLLTSPFLKITLIYIVGALLARHRIRIKL